MGREGEALRGRLLAKEHVKVVRAVATLRDRATQ
jgi:hypothetical protein